MSWREVPREHPALISFQVASNLKYGVVTSERNQKILSVVYTVYSQLFGEARITLFCHSFFQYCNGCRCLQAKTDKHL